MKIIDLLNKIANGEEVPKKIKYEEHYYELKEKYNEYWEEFEYGYKTYTGGYLNIWRKDVLNDEVEIIEEDKKINLYYDFVDKFHNEGYKLDRNFEVLEMEINKLIYEVNVLKGGKNE